MKISTFMGVDYLALKASQDDYKSIVKFFDEKSIEVNGLARAQINEGWTKDLAFCTKTEVLHTHLFKERDHFYTSREEFVNDSLIVCGLKPIPTSKCICDTRLMSWQGCQCGAFQKELELEMI